MSDFETAKIHLEKTIKIKDDFAVAYRELGKVNLMLSEYEDAITAYEKSFDLNPKLSRAAYTSTWPKNYGNFGTRIHLNSFKHIHF